MHIGTAGVAIGVRNAVIEPAFTRIIRPIGFAPNAEQVSKHIGTNTVNTEQLSINCVSTNGIKKNRVPRI